MVYRILYVSRNVSNVKREPTLSIWWKQLILKSNSTHFKNEYLGKPSGPA